MSERYKGSDDLQVYRRERMGMHPENVALDKHCSNKASDCLWDGNLARHN